MIADVDPKNQVQNFQCKKSVFFAQISVFVDLSSREDDHYCLAEISHHLNPPKLCLLIISPYTKTNLSSLKAGEIFRIEAFAAHLSGKK